MSILTHNQSKPTDERAVLIENYLLGLAYHMGYFAGKMGHMDDEREETERIHEKNKNLFMQHMLKEVSTLQTQDAWPLWSDALHEEMRHIFHEKSKSYGLNTYDPALLDKLMHDALRSIGENEQFQSMFDSIFKPDSMRPEKKEKIKNNSNDNNHENIQKIIQLLNEYDKKSLHITADDVTVAKNQSYMNFQADLSVYKKSALIDWMDHCGIVYDTTKKCFQLKNEVSVNDAADKLKTYYETHPDQMKVLAMRRDRFILSDLFWRAVDRILKSFRKPASTMGVKGAVFVKNVEDIIKPDADKRQDQKKPSRK